jgi:hypothetical protein
MHISLKSAKKAMKCEKTGRMYENFGGEKFQKWPWFLEKLAANSCHNLATLIKNKKVRKFDQSLRS